MGYVEGESRSQVVMFPEVMDDYIGAENPVRFIDAFVAQLEMGELGFKRAEPEERGRPGYDPRDLLKLYVYGYLNGIRSSRKLERETRRNVELIWLMSKLAPDHKTIADFRKDHRKVLKKVFRAFTQLCRELDLYGAELVGIDGSKFRAVNSRERNYTAAELQSRLQWVEEKIEGYLKALQEGDETEAGEATLTSAELEAKIKQLRERQGQYQQLEEQMHKSGEKQISLTDPEARLMKGRQGKHVSYNMQAAVDSRHKLIADFAVLNDENDMNCLARVAQSVQKELGVTQLKVVADRGYYNTAEIKECEAAGVEVYMERPRPKRTPGTYPLEKFTYDADTNAYVCPAGERLRYRHFDKTRQAKVYWTNACESCQLRSECTKGKIRRLKRPVGQDAADRMKVRVQQQPELVRQRKELVEHPFGTIKRAMGQDHLLLRGREKVTGEMSLTMLAYNLKRVFNVLGVEKLIARLGGKTENLVLAS